MPARKTRDTNDRRAKRSRETPPEIATDNGPESFERAFERIILRPDLALRERKS